MRSTLHAFLLGLILTTPPALMASDVAPGFITCDCSALPSTTVPITLTLTGHCDGENFTRENELVGVVFPKSDLTWTFQDLPTDRNCYFRVPDVVIAGRTYQGLNLFHASTTDPAPLPPPTDPTPTPVPPAQQSADGTKAITITDSTGGVWTLGPNLETLRNGVHMGNGRGVIYKYVASTVYVLDTGVTWFKFDAAGNRWMAVPEEPGTVPPSPSTDLNAITLKLDQLAGLLTKATADQRANQDQILHLLQNILVGLPPPPTADCTVTAVNSASVTCRTPRTGFPTVTVGQILKVIK